MAEAVSVSHGTSAHSRVLLDGIRWQKRLTGEQVRFRVARELHDTVAQDLAGLIVGLENFRREQHGRRSAEHAIEMLQDNIRVVLSNVRQLLYDLRGVPGIEKDFVGSVRDGLLQPFQQRTGIPVDVSLSRSWPSAIPAEMALNLYRIIQEAINNVERHSRASRVWISLQWPTDHSFLALTIVDDGRGFAVDESRYGFGLLGMKERALLLGGTLAVASAGDGSGTELTISVPKGEWE